MYIKTGNWSNFFCTVFILVVLHARGCNFSLHCYSCLTLDCPESKEMCDDIRQFILFHLPSFYYMGKELDDCPTITNDQGWRLAQLKADECPGLNNQPTCSLGRLQVISHIDTGSHGAFKTIISHGTVLGCGNRDLLIATVEAKQRNGCYIQNRNGTTLSGRSKHSLVLEQCSQLSDMCHQNDFCINKEESVVKTFKDQSSDGKGFAYGLVAGILGTFVILILAVMAASFFGGPLNRAHIFSKPNDSLAVIRLSDINSQNGIGHAISSAALDHVDLSETNEPVEASSNHPERTLSAIYNDISTTSVIY